MTGTALSAREIVERGETIYREILREKLEPANVGKHIAIDIETGDDEVDDDETACFRLWNRRPGPMQAGLRIGYKVAGRIGTGAVWNANAVTIFSKPKDSEWGRRAVIADPDGNRVALTETSKGYKR